jgi:2-polyprenyl-3-methyl-5-hydroxy-6-metoxy-1,4-benzoquinol methylase
MNRVHYTSCPVCSSTSINPLLTIKDHSVSKEEYVVWQCASCELRFTQDVPDADSIGQYYQSEDYISHTNTEKGFINKLYQRVRNFTLEQKAGLIKKYTKPKGNLLDLGAGTGAFLATMKGKGWNITGVEPDEGARQQAKKLFDLHLKTPNVLPQLPDASFDAITLWHVLEHVHQLHDYIEQLKRLLKGDGKIFIAVPNYTSVDAQQYGNYWAAYDVPRHLYHFAPRSIQKLMQLHELKVIEQKPMWFDSFYISLLSSKYKKGSSAWIGAGFTGLRSNLNALMNKNRCSSLIYIISKT